MRLLLLLADDLQHVRHRFAPHLQLAAHRLAARQLGGEGGLYEGGQLGTALRRQIVTREFGDRPFQRRAVDRGRLGDALAQDRADRIERVANVVHHRDRALAAPQREALYLDLLAQVFQLRQHRVEAAAQRAELVATPVVLEQRHRTRRTHPLHMSLDAQQWRQDQPRNDAAQDEQHDQQQQCRPGDREQQHPPPQQRHVAHDMESCRGDSMAIDARDRHGDRHRALARRDHRRIAQPGPVDARIEPDQIGQLARRHLPRHQHIAARRSGAVGSTHLRHTDRRDHWPQPRIEMPGVVPRDHLGEIGMRRELHQRRAQPRPLTSARGIEPARDAQRSLWGHIGHALHAQVGHRQRREAVAFERRRRRRSRRRRHVIVALRPVAIVANRVFDLGRIFAQRRLRPFDMAGDRLGLQRRKARRDDAGQQQGDAKRAGDADRGQDQHQLGTERCGTDRPPAPEGPPGP